MSASKSQASATVAGELNDEAVREYLRENGDFLQRNPDLLDYLHVPHASGSAVSLVEKQVSVLRERNVDMRHRLSALTTNARDNDKLYEQTRKLILRLLEADSLDSLYRSFVEGMRREFDVDYASMVLYGESPDGACRVEDAENVRAEIGSLLRSGNPVCGALRQEELNFLFPDAGAVGSAALSPLGDGGEFGLIAVGSTDANKYSPNMGTLFLSHIGDVIVRLLPRLRRDED